MIRITIIVMLAVALAPAAQAQTPERSYVVRRVTVIEPSAASPSRPADVVIVGRTILQITPPGNAMAPPGAVVIDGQGKYLIPGLIDSHVHIKKEDPLFLFLAAGVTTVQNMAGQPFHLAMREQTSRGTLLGPRILTAGPTTAQAGVVTPGEAEKLVKGQQALGYDVIKMYGSPGGDMTREAYHALNEAARSRGMRVVGHAPRNLPLQVVLDERQSSIDHMEEIVYTHRPFARLLQPYVDLQFGRASPQVRDSLARTPTPDLAHELKAEIAELARAVKRAGIAVTPNLVFFRNIHWMTTDSIAVLLAAPELAYAAPGQRLNWSPLLNNYANSWRDVRGIIAPYLGAVVELQKAITLAFQKAGVPLMTGTDSEFLGAQPGFAVHTELEIFVALGMTPQEALRAATSKPAEVMLIADSVVVIQAGRVADLALLDADPLADIRNTRSISGVFRAGRWLPRQELEAQLDSLARSYAPVQALLRSFMDSLEAGGADAALRVYSAAAERETIAKPVERVINSYGYRLLGERRVKEAIEVFQANTEAFPSEYNTWDSLAEAYMEDGQNDVAIRYYRKVLELRPGDENATRMLKRLGMAGP
jgi:imidazolonepropionase-like amidohydrolase